jgi:hypothetical protein
MPFAYKIYDQHRPYFITCTVHQWVDVFSRKQYADIFLDNFRYCLKPVRTLRPDGFFVIFFITFYLSQNLSSFFYYYFSLFCGAFNHLWIH